MVHGNTKSSGNKLEAFDAVDNLCFALTAIIVNILYPFFSLIGFLLCLGVNGFLPARKHDVASLPLKLQSCSPPT